MDLFVVVQNASSIRALACSLETGQSMARDVDSLRRIETADKPDDDSFVQLKRVRCYDERIQPLDYVHCVLYRDDYYDKRKFTICPFAEIGDAEAFFKRAKQEHQYAILQTLVAFA